MFGWLVQVAVVLIGTGAIFVLVKNALQRKTGVSLPAEVAAAPAAESEE
jgi:hypothetical protein